MSIRKVWKIKSVDVTEDLIQSCGGSKVLAVLLNNRGIDSKEKIIQFLNPLKGKLSSPDVFLHMNKAVERIVSAIQNNEHITVYGDFDSDGITSTALLFLTLKEIGANVDFYLPDRATESHGLNTKALVQIIAKKKTKLIVTVDCGISNVLEVNFAKSFNVDIIITDHHESPEILPDAYAIINPKVQNAIDSSLDMDTIKSLNYLAGVGVAFKLACCLLQKFSKEEFVNEILPLVAIGTIGDVVELLGENRSLVSMGIELIRAGKHNGVQRLLKSAGIMDSSSITAENIAFLIVPRLNAAGRLESPNTAINVLVSDDDFEIEKSISMLNDLNSLRQNLCDDTFKTAKMLYQKDIINNKNAIILFSEDWHIGVIGIVSSKLVECYNKPVFLMTRDANTPNIIRCSCRSIDGINIHSVLSNHKDLFVGFGGHKMAAGFSFDENKVSFLEFKKLLSKTIIEYSQNIDFTQVAIDVDMELAPEDITLDTLDLIQKLEPFGALNPYPLFVLKDTKLNNFRFMGQNNNHLKINVSKDNYNFDCIKWNYSDFNLSAGSELDLLFSIKLNKFNGTTSIQLMLEDIFSELLIDNSSTLDLKFLDHRNKKNIINQVIDFIHSSKKSTYIYMQNPILLKQLNLPSDISDKIFNINNIPSDAEQIMFFDIPSNSEFFIKIIKESNAQLVHLMNFSFAEISVDALISKLSGMLKYSSSNLNGVVNINRAITALSVDEDTLECALNLFNEVEMIDLSKEDDNNFVISNIQPVELSRLKQNDMFQELEIHLEKINSFRKFYLNSSIEDIKKLFF